MTLQAADPRSLYYAPNPGSFIEEIILEEALDPLMVIDTGPVCTLGGVPFVPVPKPEILREPDYLHWLRYRACVICLHTRARQRTSSEAAHTPRVRIHGDIAVSLCHDHHAEEERLQPVAFWAKYGLDPQKVYRAQHLVWEWETKQVAF